MDNYLAAFRKYADFSGRARRQEYWMFGLFNLLIIVAIMVLIQVTQEPRLAIIELVYALVVLIPSLSLTVRRLHDTGRSGWWILIQMIPLAGGIIFLVFMCSDSHPGTNLYGPNPKGISNGLSANAA
ncbi:DUF805 domain-containing protein [Gallaecimonas mangrovi]|uniref:DUF805 domain-containing protein n=1 Tax=Gallaecimonas mangrovi TaxID=2291597 RepID=UPI000E1FE3DB|nr:DUF805 domain-containing protein [Gallaecimonas mangrovi]